MRKSPHKHDVKKHMRSGKPVVKYKRGQGKKPVRGLKRTIKRSKPVRGLRKRTTSKKKKSRFAVTLIYNLGNTENFNVNATDYGPAIDTSMVKRTRYEQPNEIIMRSGKK